MCNCGKCRSHYRSDVYRYPFTRPLKILSTSGYRYTIVEAEPTTGRTRESAFHRLNVKSDRGITRHGRVKWFKDLYHHTGNNAIIIVVGPHGCGKTHLVNRLVEYHDPGQVTRSYRISDEVLDYAKVHVNRAGAFDMHMWDMFNQLRDNIMIEGHIVFDGCMLDDAVRNNNRLIAQRFSELIKGLPVIVVLLQYDDERCIVRRYLRSLYPEMTDAQMQEFIAREEIIQDRYQKALTEYDIESIIYRPKPDDCIFNFGSLTEGPV